MRQKCSDCSEVVKPLRIQFSSERSLGIKGEEGTRGGREGKEGEWREGRMETE